MSNEAHLAYDCVGGSGELVSGAAAEAAAEFRRKMLALFPDESLETIHEVYERARAFWLTGREYLARDDLQEGVSEERQAALERAQAFVEVFRGVQFHDSDPLTAAELVEARQRARAFFDAVSDLTPPASTTTEGRAS